MGTYTDFTGAIRITPCLKEPLAGRFRQFLGIRHMKRDVKILEALFPALEERKAVTLFGDGDFGEDGAFFLPIHTRDLTRRICLHERYAEGLTDERDMNMTPGPCPSLYCDLELRNDPDNGHSYLGWNEAEKAYYITDWIGYIAEWLSKLGYSGIRTEWEYLTKTLGVDIVVLDTPILDTTRYKDLLGSVITDIVLAVLSFGAQLEVDTKSKAQAEGIAAAHLKGVKFGRPKCSVKDWDIYYPKWKQGEITAVECYRQLGVSASTFYRLVHKFESEEKAR